MQNSNITNMTNRTKNCHTSCVMRQRREKTTEKCQRKEKVLTKCHASKKRKTADEVSYLKKKKKLNLAL